MEKEGEMKLPIAKMKFWKFIGISMKVTEKEEVYHQKCKSYYSIKDIDARRPIANLSLLSSIVDSV